MDIVRLGIIGAGDAANFHTLAFKGKPNAKARFVSVYDANEAAARRLAKSKKLVVCSDLDELLRSDVDAVLVAVPHFLHATLVRKVAEAGKHVLCEKPMATSLEECDEMIATARKAGVKLMIAENHRFLPAHRRMRELIEEDYIGKVYLGRTYEGAFCPPSQFLDLASWHFTYEKGGGGVLADQGVHKFALLNWLTGSEVESAMAYLGKAYDSPREKGEDNAVIFLRYKTGAMMEVVVSSTTPYPLNNNTELHGTKGHLLEDHSWEKPIRVFTSHPNAQKKGEYYEIGGVEHGPYPGYYLISAFEEDTHFAECILEDKEPEFTPEQAREAVAVVLLSYLAAKNGRLTSMDDLKRLAHTGQGTRQALEGLDEVLLKNFERLRWK